MWLDKCPFIPLVISFNEYPFIVRQLLYNIRKSRSVNYGYSRWLVGHISPPCTLLPDLAFQSTVFSSLLRRCQDFPRQSTKWISGNQLHFYTLIINYQKEKLRKQSHLQFHQKKNPSDKFNQGCKRSILRIIRHWIKKLKKIQISGNIYHVHGSEELTALKCPCYPKQSIDSM